MWRYENATYVNIIHPVLGLDSLTLDDQPIPRSALWQTLSNDNRFVATQLPLPVAGNGYHHLHSSRPFSAYVYAYVNTDWLKGRQEGAVQNDWVYVGYSYVPGIGNNGRIGGAPLSAELACGSSLDTLLNVLNVGTDTLIIDSARISGIDSAAFVLLPHLYPDTVLAPDAENGITERATQFAIRFAPTHYKLSTATLLVWSSDREHSPYKVQLTGLRDSIGIGTSRTKIDFGTRLSCDGDTSTSITLTNTGTLPANVRLTNLFNTGFGTVPNGLEFTLGVDSSRAVDISFNPTRDSIYQQALVVYTQCDSFAIPLRGVRTTPNVTALDKDFGSVCAADSIVKNIFVRNPSDTTIVLQDASTTSPFVVSPNQLPLTIAPHDSVPVQIVFAPSTDGNFSSTFKFGGEPCDVGAFAQLRGARGTATLSATGADFGTVCVGGSVTKSIVVRNTGTVASSVDSIVGSNAFKILTPIPIIVNDGDSQIVSIQFSPAANAQYASNVQVFASPCNIVAQSFINGTGALASATLNNLDFGFVTAAHDSVIVFRNTGTDTITATSAMLQSCNSCPFTITANLPQQISPGDSILLAVHFAPIANENDSAIVCVNISSPCVETICATIAGREQITTTPSAGVCPDSVSVQQWGSEFILPITLADSVANISTIAFTIFFNPIFLRYDGIASSATPATQNAIASGEERITIPNILLPAGAVLCEARFIALASSNDTVTTTIAIDSIVVTPATNTAPRCATTVTIAPPCGLQGVAYSGNTTISELYPNPITSDGNILVKINSGERSGATLKVYDMLGSVVEDLSSALRSSTTDESSLQINTTKLSASVYTVVLQTAVVHVTRQIMVVR